jgi:hypothetical protein
MSKSQKSPQSRRSASAQRAPQREPRRRRLGARPPARPSRLLLALMARVDGWLGRLLRRFSGWLQARRDRKRRAATPVRGFRLETLEPRLLMSADLMPAPLPQMSPAMGAFSSLASERSMIDGPDVTASVMLPPAPEGHRSSILAAPTANTSTVIDGDGTEITASIAGEGLVSLTAQDGGFVLAVTGSNASSVLNLSATGGDGRARLTGIDVTAALGSANLGLADLSGLARFAGGVAQLALGDASNATIRNTAVGASSFTAADLADVRLIAPQADLAITVASWLPSVAGALPASNLIQAAGITRLAVGGDFGADVQVSGAGLSGDAVDLVTVTGALRSGLWMVNGNLRLLQAGSVEGGWRGQVTGEFGSLRTSGGFSGTLATQTLRSFDVGSLRGANVLVGALLGTDGQIGGSGGAADQFVLGTLGVFKVGGNMIDSRVAVSVNPADDGYFDGNDTTVAGATPAIESITVGGQLGGNNVFTAPALPTTASIGGQTVNTATQPGFSTDPGQANVPAIWLALANDSGAGDLLTNDAALHVVVVDGSNVVAVQARLGGTGDFQQVAFTADPRGGLRVPMSALEQLNGSPLLDGQYTVQLRTLDYAGTLSAEVGLTLTLDRSAPPLTGPVLAAAGDTGTAGDHITTAASVTLSGTTTAGATVRLGARSATAAADGSFSFAGVALPLGASVHTFVTSDAAGNSTSASRTLTRVTVPTVTATLASDTGVSASDRITSNPAIRGSTSGSAGITQLLAVLDPTTPNATMTDVSASLGAGGSLAIDRARLDIVAGGNLTQGAHTLRLVAVDAAGHRSAPVELSFTFDNLVPTVSSAGLAAASDSGTVGDGITTAASVTVQGIATPGAILSLGAASTTAASDGRFSFANVGLALGSNSLSLGMRDLAGNSGTATLELRRVSVPALTAQLASDSGNSASDGLTSNPAVSGSASGSAGITQLLLALDPAGANAVLVDATAALANDGSFNVDLARLNTLAGGTLAQGAHTLRLVAVDAGGHRTVPLDLAFNFDNQAPTLVSAGLATASDTGTVGDRITTEATVTIVGLTSAGATVTLGAASTTAAADGSFSFADVALVLGTNTLNFTFSDAAGNNGSGQLVVTRESGVVQGPVVTVRVTNDTGRSSTDGASQDPAISGTATDATAVTTLRVVLDPATADAAMVDITDLLNAATGEFALDRARLDQLAGGTLAEGNHVLRVEAVDGDANVTRVNFSFRFDTQAPAAGTVGVSNLDSLNGDATRTTSGVVALRGTAEAGAVVTLAAQGLSAQAAGDGSFTMPGVSLALGANDLAFTVADAAGNSTAFNATLTREAATASTDVVLQWNAIALESIRLTVTDPPLATRLLALQSLAVYDTLAAIEGSPAFMVQRSVSGEVSAQAAAVAAAHRILSLHYPSLRTALDASLANSLSAIADGAAKTAGVTLGASIADAVWSLRQDDGSAAFVDFPAGADAGEWRPTEPMFDVADQPQWPGVAPFALTSASQFRSAAPPALDSPEYAAAYNEVLTLGAAEGSTRTADQTELALFWADGAGTYSPPGHWNQIAAIVASSEGNSLSANARLFAQLNVAMADASIASWDTKYAYAAWRPETAIHHGDEDNNAATAQDLAWRSLLISPPHPEYLSGHSTYSNAAAAVLASHFGDATAFTTGSVGLPGVQRSYDSFSAAATDAGRSRVYGGIHFDFSNTAGAVMGAQVAQAVLDRFALSEDIQAPTVTTAAVPVVTNGNLTLVGQVLDNLSGVASASFRIDGGAWQALGFDAQGNWTLTTALALDGSADGQHLVEIEATDAAGNTSTALSRSFLLDTQAPTVTLAGVADGDAITAATTVSGSVDGTGTAVVSLAYQLDSGTSRNIIFSGSANAFSQALAVGALNVGEHVLKLTATDAAGNSTTVSRAVRIDALSPFTLAGVSPAGGAGEVGVTFRPQVNFSRAVNPATLTADTLYATDPAGNKLAATIVPAADGSFAWLFFNAPLPGGAAITINVVGSGIRAAADGSFLDADGNGVAGGSFASSFTTVSSAAVAGTSLRGRVVDPGTDLLPMTFDDIRRGPDGVIHTPDDVFLNPIVGAKVFILGRESEFVLTDANGYFELTNVPAGEVKVAIDGRTATNAPDGIFWPEMVMSAQMRPGVANTLMDTMGTNEERVANAGRVEVYLPRVQENSLQDVADSGPTTVTVTDAASAPGLTDAQRQELTLTIQGGTAVGENGQVLNDVQIGISTVPPELARDMLPPGVLQHTFDITIQAPGVATFTEPVQITFPNVFGAAPGTKLNILSFDHTTGRLVINGTGTVSADGLTVVSDPEAGVRAPGWHGLTPPGTEPDDEDPECPTEPAAPPEPEEEPEPTEVLVGLLTGDEPTPDELNDYSIEPPPEGYLKTVTVTVDPELFIVLTENGGLFGDNDIPLSGGSWNLTSDDDALEFDWIGESYDVLESLGVLDEFAIYGGLVTIRESVQKEPEDEEEGEDVPEGECPPPPEGEEPPVVTIQEFAIYRYVNPVHAAQSTFTNFFGLGIAEDELPFPDAVENGAGASTQQHDLALYIGSGAADEIAPSTAVGEGFFAAGGTGSATVTFDPVSAKLYEDTLILRDGIELTLEGLARAQQQVAFDRQALIDIIVAIRDFTPAHALPAALRTAFADPATVADGIMTLASAYYSGSVGSAIGISTGAGTEGSKSLFANSDPANPGLSGTAGPGFGTGIDSLDGINALVAQASSMSNVVKEYLLPQAINPDRAGNASTFILALTTWGANSTLAPYQQAVARTIAHELGHTLGLSHIQGAVGGNSYNITGSATPDVMAYDGWSAAGASFSTSLDALFLALDQEVTAARVAAAMTYYTTARTTGGSGQTTPDGFFEIHDEAIVGKAAVLLDAADSMVVSAADFGTVELADGRVTRGFNVANLGTEPVTVSEAELFGDESFSMALPADFFTVLAPGQTRSFSVSYTPDLGLSEGVLRLQSDASRMVLNLAAQGTAAGAALAIDAGDNNLGGAVIGRATTDTQAIKLINHGQQTLTITGLALREASSAFALNGIPADLATNPISLAPGASLDVSVTFSPQTAGLQRATLEVLSNDAANPVAAVGLTGTGLRPFTVGEWGNDFVQIAFPDLGDGATLQLKTSASGDMDGFLPENAHYVLTLFDPTTGLVARGEGVTGASGTLTDLSSQLVFKPSLAADSDSDGLPDDVERAIGSNLNGRDTDRDGLDDFTEIDQGLDPLGGLGLPVGVVSSVALQGKATAVTVIGTADAVTTALVATGSAGLAVVDVSRFTTPIVRAELDLPGDNIDVAADPLRGLAVVAAGASGVHIVDLSDPDAPTLVRTVGFAAAVRAVEVVDGIAYVASGDTVFTLDLNTGETRSSIDIGSTVTALALEAGTLFTLDTARTLRSTTVDGDVLTPRDALALAQGEDSLFVGGGVAYIGIQTQFSQGFVTVDVSNAADLVLLSGPDATNVAGQRVVSNGSGLIVSTGYLRGPQGQEIFALDRLGGSDLTNTGAFQTRVNLPDAPLDLTLANGLAFVAAGEAGLQIVNYVNFDTAGEAPQVSLAVEAIDADPDAAGVQVIEGRTLRVVPATSDDVQVRNVELLVNGVVVANDVSFPHEMFVQVPAISAGGTQVTVQVRATDTGGNVGISDVLSFQVVPDTFPPQLSVASIADGDRRFFVRSVDFVFDEPLNTALLDPAQVTLRRAGNDGLFDTADDVVVPVTLDTRSFGQSLSVLIGSLLPAGDYRLTVNAAIIADNAGNTLAAPIVRSFAIRPASDVTPGSGVPAIPNAPAANPGQQIGFAVPFDPSIARAEFQITDAAGNVSTRTLEPVRFDDATGRAFFTVPLDGVTGDLVVYGLDAGTRVDFADGTVPLQILPVITGVDIQSVASDGSSAVVLITGLGFTEGVGSEYRFGTETVVDEANNTGPDVQGRYDALLNQSIANGQVRLTVPLVEGAFGAVVVSTGGGSSAAFTTGLAEVVSVALSGTAADATEASANAGQAVQITGSGLTTSSDLLLRWTDTNGSARMTVLRPTVAAADGSSATVLIPHYANGAPRLQMLGSSVQPLLQIVPVLSGYDVQDRLVVYGSGFTEGAGSYSLPGATAEDNAAAGDTIDVYYSPSFSQENASVYLNRTALPAHGSGPMTVTTAGGTSAALQLDVTRVNVAGTTLGDVAIDAEGKYWIADYTNPGSLLRIEPGTGAVLSTIALSAAYGLPYSYNHSGLQVLGAGMTLGASSVPAGSLLVFNGYPSPDRIVAVNPADGSVIASLNTAGNHDLMAGVFDAASGNLFILASNVTGNNMLEINAATGALINTIAVPLDPRSHAGIAIDPSSGNLWIGSTNGGAQVVEITRGGVEVRRIDLGNRGVNQNEISGLAFAADGRLAVASTQGAIYLVDLDQDVAAVPAPTLTQINGRVNGGVAANPGQAASHVGDVIELVGSNFGAGSRVLFNVRDDAGNTRLVSITPLVINADGTRMQVAVPGQASSGDIRVVNQGAINLGGNGSYADAAYRNVSVQFTAGGSTAEVRFADGGLEDIGNESWGLDNVRVSQGAATIFADDFETGSANAAWSNTGVSSANRGSLSRFLGQINNGNRVLSLSGLTAGQTYDLSFDLYVLDTWEGAATSQGPDLIDVSVDGTSVLRETFANNYTTDTNDAQTYNTSAGVRLQIVPTLVRSEGGSPGGTNPFNLIGSGFMEGASTVTIGGVALVDDQNNTSPFDVYGSRNENLSVLAPLTLDGPIRVSTEGGYAEIAGPSQANQPLSAFTGIQAVASSGVPGNPAAPAAVTGQTIVLQGQGFTSQSLVQFVGVDDSGRLGTLTRSGSASNGGTTLSVVVPALARTGAVTVLGSGASHNLQIVPTLASVGGTVAAGNTLVLEGTGLTGNDIAISIDGQGVGAFSVRTVTDGAGNTADQQLVTLTVPAGVSAGVVRVSTAGGSAVWRAAPVQITALAALSPANDVGDTLATALDTALTSNQSRAVNTNLVNGLDVDLYRVEMLAGEELRISLGNTPSTAAHIRVFDAAGVPVGEAGQGYRYFDDDTAFVVQARLNGSYYVGISAYYNNAYDPTVAGSGQDSFGAGSYTLNLDRREPGTRDLTRIEAAAGSGTATHGGVAAANTGQTITLHGVGLSADNTVYFTASGSNGQLFQEQATPVSAAADGSSLTVVVPPDATSGAVRVGQDGSGVLLQIVPTLSDVLMNANSPFVGGSLTLTGSGFAEGQTTVRFGNQAVQDLYGSYGLNVYNDNTQLNMTVPAKQPPLPVGPIRVSTVGGVSEAFGLTLAGLSSTASSGTPAQAGRASALPGQVITLSGTMFTADMDVVFEITDDSGNRTDRVVRPATVTADGSSAQVTVPLDAVSGSVRLVGDINGGSVFLQIVPLVTDIEIESVTSDGSAATVLLSGLGFVEGGGSAYRFGNDVVLDAGTGTGPDVYYRYEPVTGTYIPNGQVRLTVPLVEGAFGAVVVSTGGGSSAAFTTGLAEVVSVALSGTAADATEASANAGQAVQITGSGLTTSSDLLLRWTDTNGSARMTVLRPTVAAADGSSATVLIPHYANGAPRLQMLGSSVQPLLQIVPVLSGYDVQDRLVVYGSGFTEGAGSYSLPGATAEDNAAAGDTIDVYYSPSFSQENASVYLNRTALPAHGSGPMTVTTAGGTSAALQLDVTRVNVAGTTLGDVAIDAEGKYWIADYTNPGSLLRIEPGTGAVLSTIALSAAYGLPYSYNHSGLQVLGAGMTLGASSVPAGSLLVFNGYPSPDRIVAVNPADGSVIASLNTAGNHDLMAGVFDAASGNLFILASNVTGNNMLEINAATGALINTIAVPLDPRSHAGIAIDPSSGNLWIGSTNGGAQVVEITRGGVEVRRIDLGNRGVNQNEISGLAFAADGRLAVASTQGAIYLVDLDQDVAAVPAPTLTQINGRVNGGVAANPGQAASHVGDVIELVGSNFGAGSRVLFNVRDDAGNTRLVSITPLVINADGTRMQVAVPGQASSGDIRVVNQGAINLGGNGSYADAAYRNVSVQFTAGGSTAEVRFADGGLEDIGNESWGLDNVRVSQGAATIFADDFETGSANAAWSNTGVSSANRGSLSRFLGQINNGNRVLSLSGLTAGQTYDLSFDLYVLDTWEGAATSQGPDLIDVSVDGTSVLRETFANNYTTDTNDAQTYNTSAGVRLQIVPTLVRSEGGSPGGTNPFNLIGSGFMEGASTVTIGGVALVDDQNNTSPFDVYGSRNENLSVLAPLTLDGPIRVSTEGGYAEIAGPSQANQPLSAFTGIQAVASSGVPGNPAAPAAVTGQTIVLQGQGFTSQSLVQFVGVDDSGRLGTLTRSGSASNGGTTLSVVVPALARTGAVTVLGSGASHNLQIVPTLASVGGTVAAGNTLVLEGTGLTGNDIAISIDGQGVGAFSVRTVTDGAGNTADQQLVTLTVPAGVSAGVVRVSTAGGSAVWRAAPVQITALAALSPANDVGDTLATALDTALTSNQSRAVNSAIANNLDVDLYQVALVGGERLALALGNNAGSANNLMIFDAAGRRLLSNEIGYRYYGDTTPLNFTATATGLYYVGVSAYGNISYNPSAAGSGANGSGAGSYTLNIERMSEGNRHTSSLVAAAGSGTAAQAGVAAANIGQLITLNGNGLRSNDVVVFSGRGADGNLTSINVTPAAVGADGSSLTVVVPDGATTGTVRLQRDFSGAWLQIVPVVTDVRVSSVSGDGTTAVIELHGTGFAEFAGSSYLIGGTLVRDIGSSYGPDVFSRADAALGRNVENGLVRITVQVSDALFGAIRVDTAGGSSASFTRTLASITAVAASGTPADAGEASANAGQEITLVGTGLSLNSDVLLRWTDSNGSPRMLVLRPTAAAADGTAATMLLPNDANGVRQLQMLGSTSAPLLQIVPVLTSYDVQGRLVLFGSGLVEGDGSYSLPGAQVFDDDGGNGTDVYYSSNFSFENGSVYLDRTVLPRHGAGTVTVTTSAGTSAPLNLTVTRPSVVGTTLGDVAVDAQGKYWVSDYTNPGSLLRIEPSTGAVLSTLSMTAGYGTAYTYNHSGIQVLTQAITLGATNVPAGSLLLFNGYVAADRVVAIDPANGSVIASLTLDANYDLVAGVFDATSGHLFIVPTLSGSNRMVEIDPATGLALAAITLPVSVGSHGGIAIDPTSGNLWVGGTGTNNIVVEVTRTGTEVRRVDLAALGVNQNEISGLAFAGAGDLRVASTQGAIYEVALPAP